MFGPCDINLYNSITLFFNDRYNVKLMPESFVIDIGDREKCFIPFSYNQEDYWVIGEPFFRNFYTIFDDARGMIGIAPSVNFVHASITEGVVPNDELAIPGRKKHPGVPEREANKDKLPNFNDPLSVISYMWKTVENYVGSIFSGGLFNSGGNKSGGIIGGKDSIFLLIAIGVALTGCLCCCSVVAIYGIITYLKY